ncbi:DNA-methyltransferase [Trueperella pyogenes]
MQVSKKEADTLIPGEATTLTPGQTYLGDSREIMKKIADDSVDLSVWSPPYFVGKDYEAYLDFEGWKELLRDVIKEHARILKPGAFMAINIADILAFPDVSIPRFQADVISTKRSGISREMVLQAQAENPDMNRYQLAELLGCSEQTIHRRLSNNNVRGGKYHPQTRVKTVAGLVEHLGLEAGLPMYDRRVWVKDPTWANSRWHSSSYRAVDEFEYIFVFWKPGITTVDRRRLQKEEWGTWGSRGVWYFKSVRSNSDHEAKFPIELPTRLIRMLTDPGGLVLDPFMGSGTTALAAMQTGREFIGIEKEEKYVRMANLNTQRAANITPLF